jgi:predicted transcriptional regulator
MFDILDGAEKGESRTGIMYRTRISYAMLVRYLDTLVERGFIVKLPDRSYALTRRGRTLQHDIRRVIDHFDDSHGTAGEAEFE